MPSSARSSAARIAAIVLVGASLTNCAHYQANPLALPVSATAFEARRISIPPTGTLTYQAALSTALANAAPVAQARAAYRSAVTAAQTARIRPAMTLTLTAEYSKDSDPKRPWLYGGLLDVPLDLGGARSGRIDAAELAIVKARYDLIEAIWTARMALRRALLDRDVARLEVEAADRQADLRRQRLIMFERRVAAGEDSRSVALVAATDLTLAGRRQVLAHGNLSAAQAALGAAMGVTSEAMAGLEIASGPDSAFSPSDIPGLRKDAAIGRADVLRAAIDYDLAELGLRTAIAGQYPQVTIGPGYTWERGLTKLPFNLGLVLPPTDLNRAAIREAEARRVEAGAGVEAAQATVFAQTDAAWAALKAAEIDGARIRNDDLPLARHTLALTERAVALGEIDRTDALGAQAGLLDAELAAIDADRLRATALADLEAATRQTADPSELTLLSAAVAATDTLP
ncbi:hypothetical protein BH10PSE2_BH10PSE2_20090 [soil metagenome]